MFASMSLTLILAWRGSEKVRRQLVTKTWTSLCIFWLFYSAVLCFSFFLTLHFCNSVKSSWIRWTGASVMRLDRSWRNFLKRCPRFAFIWEEINSIIIIIIKAEKEISSLKQMMHERTLTSTADSLFSAFITNATRVSPNLIGHI